MRRSNGAARARACVVLGCAVHSLWAASLAPVRLMCLHVPMPRMYLGLPRHFSSSSYGMSLCATILRPNVQGACWDSLTHALLCGGHPA